MQPTPAPKIFKDDCRIDWSRPSADVHNLVRGLSPYPTAWTVLSDGETEHGTLKIFETRRTSVKAEKAGRVTVDGSRMLVDCADFALEIVSLQAPGKRRMPTADFLRGCRFTDMTLR